MNDDQAVTNAYSEIGKAQREIIKVLLEEFLKALEIACEDSTRKEVK